MPATGWPPLPLLLMLLLTLAALSVTIDQSEGPGVCQSPAKFVPRVNVSCPRTGSNGSRVAWSRDSQMCAAKCASNKAWCNAFYQLQFSCVLFDYTARFSADEVYAGCPALVFVKEAGSRQLTLGNCSQSSTYPLANCSLAYDGNTSGKYYDGSCTTTNNVGVAWWQAVVQGQLWAYISGVTLFNRLDCCGDRLLNVNIAVDGVECAQYPATGLVFASLRFPCGLSGSVIRVQKLDSNTYLGLCEVVVDGY